MTRQRHGLPLRRHDFGWARKPPFSGAYNKGQAHAAEGEPNRSHLIYTNRGWGHQFMTAYDHGYRDQLRRQAPVRRLKN